MMYMIVNTKGQIVIPKSIRDQFGIQPGQEVEFKAENGKLVLIKNGSKQAIRRWAGKLKFKFPKGVKTSDTFIEEIRGQ